MSRYLTWKAAYETTVEKQVNSYWWARNNLPVVICFQSPPSSTLNFSGSCDVSWSDSGRGGLWSGIRLTAAGLVCRRLYLTPGLLTHAQRAFTVIHRANTQINIPLHYTTCCFFFRHLTENNHLLVTHSTEMCMRLVCIFQFKCNEMHNFSPVCYSATRPNSSMDLCLSQLIEA